MKKVLLMAAVAKCAEINGGARRVLEMTVAYVKDRVQFGKPVERLPGGSTPLFKHAHLCRNPAVYDRSGGLADQCGLAFEKEASVQGLGQRLLSQTRCPGSSVYRRHGINGGV